MGRIGNYLISLFGSRNVTYIVNASEKRIWVNIYEYQYHIKSFSTNGIELEKIENTCEFGVNKNDSHQYERNKAYAYISINNDDIDRKKICSNYELGVNKSIIIRHNLSVRAKDTHRIKSYAEIPVTSSVDLEPIKIEEAYLSNISRKIRADLKISLKYFKIFKKF